MMASRAAAALRTAALRTAALQGYFRRTASTAAAHAERPKAKPVGDYVPVYVALGMIGLAVTLGAHTARQQLAHAPNVWVDKRKRETVPEVADPDLALDEAERFVGGSMFRKVAHVQDDRSLTAGVADPVADYPARRVVTLKDVGVDPPGIPEQSRRAEQGGRPRPDLQEHRLISERGRREHASTSVPFLR